MSTTARPADSDRRPAAALVPRPLASGDPCGIALSDAMCGDVESRPRASSDSDDDTAGWRRASPPWKAGTESAGWGAAAQAAPGAASVEDRSSGSIFLLCKIEFCYWGYWEGDWPVSPSPAGADGSLSAWLVFLILRLERSKVLVPLLVWDTREIRRNSNSERQDRRQSVSNTYIQTYATHGGLGTDSAPPRSGRRRAARS